MDAGRVDPYGGEKRARGGASGHREGTLSWVGRAESDPGKHNLGK